MPYIFPGMNPYLEHLELFPGLHHLLISEIARLLSPQLRPKYRVAVEVRMYEITDESSLLVGIPDVIVKNRQTITDSTITKQVAGRRSQVAGKKDNFSSGSKAQFKKGYWYDTRSARYKASSQVASDSFTVASTISRGLYPL